MLALLGLLLGLGKLKNPGNYFSMVGKFLKRLIGVESVSIYACEDLTEKCQVTFADSDSEEGELDSDWAEEFGEDPNYQDVIEVDSEQVYLLCELGDDIIEDKTQNNSTSEYDSDSESDSEELPKGGGSTGGS